MKQAGTVNEALNNNSKGFYTGHRLVLPFRCQILKMMVQGEVITEFVGGDNVKIHQDPVNTSVYLRTRGSLNEMSEGYQLIKFLVCEWNADVCDRDNHIKIVCKTLANNEIEISLPGEDVLFI